MPAPLSRFLSLRACAGLLIALASTALSAGACTLLVDAQLSEKAEATDGAVGPDGEGSGGGSSQSSSSQSSSSQSSSSGANGLMCPSGYADCDESANNGCEVYVKGDVKNCGACKNVCPSGEKCTEGTCK